MLSEYFLIAEILKPQGIKGEVKIKVYTDDIENLFSQEKLYKKEKESYVPINIENIRSHGSDIVVLFENVLDRNMAESLRGTKLYISRAEASPLAEGEFYISDVIGFKVQNDMGEEVGILKDILTEYINDVYVLSTKRGRMMFPAIKQVFDNIDLENQVLVLKKDILEQIASYEDDE